MLRTIGVNVEIQLQSALRLIVISYRIWELIKPPVKIFTWTTAFNIPDVVPSGSGYVTSDANSYPTAKYAVIKNLEKYKLYN